MRWLGWSAIVGWSRWSVSAGSGSRAWLYGLWLGADVDTVGHARQAVAEFERAGTPSLLSVFRQPLAQALMATEPAAALAELERSISEATAIDDGHWSITSADVFAAIISLRLDDDTTANQHLRRSLARSIERHVSGPLQSLLYVCAASLARDGQYHAAARALGAVEATGHLGLTTHGVADQARQAVTDALGGDAETYLDAGRRLDLFDAAQQALDLLPAGGD